MFLELILGPDIPIVLCVFNVFNLPSSPINIKYLYFSVLQMRKLRHG